MNQSDNMQVIILKTFTHTSAYQARLYIRPHTVGNNTTYINKQEYNQVFYSYQSFY